MLSVLVPIFNYNVYPLIKELHKQCTDCGIAFEILCQDDASNSNVNVINEQVNTLPYCSFIALQENLAHRANRNSLAAQAQFEYLLFIDGDSVLIDPYFIKKYIDNLQNFDVVYGGRLHPAQCPSKNQKLRWKYGRYIEDIPAANRKKKPYQSLLFNNTVIKKDCFNTVKFDKDLKKYGHDDTQLSYQLSLLKFKVNHIENPVIHGDIDTNLVYLNKTRESLQNLILLYEEEKIDVTFVKLMQLYDFLKRIKFNFIISKTHVLLEKYMVRNLTGNNPNLLLFNWFRVGYLCSLNSKN